MSDQEKKPLILSQATLIPVGAVIGLVAVIWWGATITGKQSADAQRIADLSVRLSAVETQTNTIREDLSSIKADIRNIAQKLKIVQ